MPKIGLGAQTMDDEELLGGASLREALGFHTGEAFRAAARNGRLPIKLVKKTPGKCGSGRPASWRSWDRFRLRARRPERTSDEQRTEAPSVDLPQRKTPHSKLGGVVTLFRLGNLGTKCRRDGRGCQALRSGRALNGRPGIEDAIPQARGTASAAPSEEIPVALARACGDRFHGSLRPTHHERIYPLGRA